jgi:hypothetical protein
MKVSAVLCSLLSAASAVSLFGSSQNAMVDDDKKVSVPGKNPLNVRCSEA